MAKIYINAGHGGRDSGAVLGTRYEKNYTLPVSNKVALLLKNAGHTIYQNRTTDVVRDVVVDANDANAKNVDAVIEIHLNSNVGNAGTGTETYCSISGRGKALATAINSQIVSLGFVNRGVKTKTYVSGGITYDYFGIIRRTKANTVLIETAFVNNNSDMAKYNINTMAQAITNGILKIYPAVSKPATPTTPTPIPTNTTTNIKIGSKVTIKSGAVYGGLSIARGRVIPSAYTVNTKQFTVKKLATHKGTQEALLDGISSWVSLSSLSLISSNKPPSVADTSTTKPVANKPSETANTYTKGEKLELKNEPLYTTSSVLKETKTISGVYYVHDGEVFNNRVRITNAISRVGSGQVTGWISVKPVSAIPNINTNANENAQKNENNYNAGNKVTLKNAQLFSTAYTKDMTKSISGNYYIYNGKETNGRFIITNTPANVGKVPTGWVNKTDIGKSI